MYLYMTLQQGLRVRLWNEHLHVGLFQHGVALTGGKDGRYSGGQRKIRKWRGGEGGGVEGSRGGGGGGLDLGLRYGDHHPHVSWLQDGVGLVAIDGVGGVGGDVADTISVDPGVASLHHAVLVLRLEAILVVAQLVVSYCEAELVGVGGVDDFLQHLSLLRGAKGNTHKT